MVEIMTLFGEIKENTEQILPSAEEIIENAQKIDIPFERLRNLIEKHKEEFKVEIQKQIEVQREKDLTKQIVTDIKIEPDIIKLH